MVNNQMICDTWLKEKIDEHINSHQRKADLAYERAWFKEMEQELAIVAALTDLKNEVI